MIAAIKKISITVIFFAGIVFASHIFAAANFEVTEVGRNVTQGDMFGGTVVGLAGTDVIQINIDVLNIGNAATSASTTLSATLPAGVEYQANSTRLFSIACGNFTMGCAISDSASESAFPLDDPYLVGVIDAGDDFSIQYRIKMNAGETLALTVPAATMSDPASGVSGNSGTLAITPDLPPVITLNGSSTINLFVSQAYVEPGAVATDETDGTISGNIIVSGVVNTNAPGTYTRTYNVSDSSGNAATQKTRTIIVSLDSVKPVITPTGSSTVILVVGNSYADAGAAATDNIQGNLTGSIVTTNPVSTSTPGTYTVRYNVTDSSGNAADEVTRIVKVLATPDTTPPVITLLGSASVTLTVGDAYVDAGATANDNVDGVITANIITSSTVATSTAGTYTVRYNVTDISGNAATEVVRTVVVNDPPSPTPPPPVIVGGGGGGGGGWSPPTPTPQVVPTSSLPIVTQTQTDFIFTKDLAFGDSGTDVTELQKRLTKEGSYSGATTGSFDVATLQAVKAYQKAKGVIATGYVGAMTRAELNRRTIVPTPTAPTTSPTVGGSFARNLTIGARGADVTALQNRLTQEGFYSGPITGYFGNLTQAAVRKYQLAKNIAPAVGYVGPLTRLALSAAGTPAPSTPTPAPQTYIVQTPAAAPVNVAEAQNKINALQAQLLNLLKLLEEARKAR